MTTNTLTFAGFVYPLTAYRMFDPATLPEWSFTCSPTPPTPTSSAPPAASPREAEWSMVWQDWYGSGYTLVRRDEAERKTREAYIDGMNAALK